MNKKLKTAIETINLTKKFKNSKKSTIALDSVDLKIDSGELFVIVGPNGAGKTTLLKILSTLILPTSGWAYVNGFDVISEETNVKKSIGTITSDERSFYWRLTGRENLKFFANLHGIKNKERLNEVMEMLEIENYADKMFYTYSSGIKQRFSIARGILHNPKILLIDEPTHTLDPITSRRIRVLIKDYIRNSEKIVIMVTHNLMEAEELSDRIAIMDKGKILYCGKLDDLKKNFNEKSLDDIFYKLSDKNV